jgi:hypothetical protein
METGNAQTQPDEYGKQKNKKLGGEYFIERWKEHRSEMEFPKKIFQSNVEGKIRKQIIIFIA